MLIVGLQVCRVRRLVRQELQGVGDDLLGFVDDGVEVSLVAEALGVDLVDVLGAGRPGREPAALRRRPSSPPIAAWLAGARVSLATIGSPARSDALTAEGSSFCSRAFCSGVAGASIRV